MFVLGALAHYGKCKHTLSLDVNRRRLVFVTKCFLPLRLLYVDMKWHGCFLRTRDTGRVMICEQLVRTKGPKLIMERRELRSNTAHAAHVVEVTPENSKEEIGLVSDTYCLSTSHHVFFALYTALEADLN